MIAIGIDCATQASRVGLALGEFAEGEGSLVSAEVGRSGDALVRRIAEWLPASGPALLALDAPLGWPAALGEALAGHAAGGALRGDPNLLFRRDTDRFVKAAIGKQPLDVGADRIARTAHAALRLLGAVREASGREIPLAQAPGVPAGAVAIEVYPAATLAALGLRSSGYKKRGDGKRRREILRGLAGQLRLPADTAALEANADALDAAVCLVAACDFLRGEAIPPRDRARAEREGWIWVRRRRARD